MPAAIAQATAALAPGQAVEVIEALQALATRRGFDLPDGIALEMDVEVLASWPRDLFVRAFRIVWERFAYRRLPEVADFYEPIKMAMTERRERLARLQSLKLKLETVRMRERLDQEARQRHAARRERELETLRAAARRAASHTGSGPEAEDPVHPSPAMVEPQENRAGIDDSAAGQASCSAAEQPVLPEEHGADVDENSSVSSDKHASRTQAFPYRLRSDRSRSSPLAVVKSGGGGSAILPNNKAERRHRPGKSPPPTCRNDRWGMSADRGRLSRDATVSLEIPGVRDPTAHRSQIDRQHFAGVGAVDDTPAPAGGSNRVLRRRGARVRRLAPSKTLTADLKKQQGDCELRWVEYPHGHNCRRHHQGRFRQEHPGRLPGRLLGE
ncbi:hypothetical protein GGE65_004377 [Skermanella aerolata]|uniref:hypothetical protein n=1 Tax=Skermanella aerolata TaxID=393310 RepID=UPI003D19C6C0